MSTISLKNVKLGDNADPSKNFVISVPSVADGTLTIKRENGTNVLSIDANGKAVIPGVVGTVAQVGGVPTGQVVERGSNANGEYVRFADGTQICVGPVPAAGTNRTVTFPAAFINAGANVSARLTVSSAETGFVHAVNSASVSTTSAVLCPRYASAASFGIAGEAGQYNAIGRWF